MTISQDRASSSVDRNATEAKRARSNRPPKLGRKHDRASSVRRIAYIAPKRKRILVRIRTPQVDGKIKLAVVRNVLNDTRAPGRKRCLIESPISTHRCLPTSGSQQERHKQKEAHPVVPGRPICGMRMPCGGRLRRAREGIEWLRAIGVSTSRAGQKVVELPPACRQAAQGTRKLETQPRFRFRPPSRMIFHLEVGTHVTAEQVDVFQAQLMGHRTKMQRGEQMADAGGA